MHRQVESPIPTPCPLLHRGPIGISSGIANDASIWATVQPPSLQFLRFRGVPLYPVLITLFSLTRTQPTRLFIQLLLCAASDASCIKYRSQLGRRRCSSVRSSLLNASCNSDNDEAALIRRTCANSNSFAKPDAESYK